MALLYFDCFSGASGDMVLGALIDAGVPLDDVRDALGSLAVDRDAIWTERVTRAGITATKFHVRGEDEKVLAYESRRSHAHGEGQTHVHTGNGPGSSTRSAVEHRSLAEIRRLIDGSRLASSAKERAKALFQRLGEVEADIHGVSLEQVHLHEVGALDSIIDIVGSVYALERLGVKRAVSSPLNLGSGTIRSAHGSYPVPAPATLSLLQGAPVYAGPQQTELVTPTGALLVSSYASSYGSVPPMRVQRVGYGAGARDFHERPNVLRVIVGEEDSSASSQTVVVLEAEIDDMNPQIFGTLMEGLLNDGALDVYYTPVQMKKNRPGTLLSVISRPEDQERHKTRIFRETTTIGIRYREMSRDCLDREVIRVDTEYGAVSIKIARRQDEVFNASPEFEDCVRLARESGHALKDIQAAAMKAYLDRTRP